MEQSWRMGWLNYFENRNTPWLAAFPASYRRGYLAAKFYQKRGYLLNLKPFEMGR